jgi:hypothetical protein
MPKEIARKVPLVTMIRHNDRMSRWLEQRSAWQYFVLVWATTVTAVLISAIVIASPDRGRMPAGLLEFVFSPLAIAAGATLGRQKRKTRAGWMNDNKRHRGRTLQTKGHVSSIS